MFPSPSCSGLRARRVVNYDVVVPIDDLVDRIVFSVSRLLLFSLVMSRRLGQ